MKASKGRQDYWSSFDDTYSNYDATIHIKNATHVIATLTIYTFNLPAYLGRLHRHSITYVYVKNTTSIEKPYTHTSLGKRCEGDELIYFESRNDTNINRFPSRAFEYSGRDEYLTYVRFSFNVSEAITFWWLRSNSVHIFNFSHQRQLRWSTPLSLTIKNLMQLFMI